MNALQITRPTLLQKAQLFRGLHAAPGGFVIPNPWDAGSAKLLASLGFKALATTSAGAAFAMGRPDHGIDRSALLGHLRAVTAATSLPVSADLGHGFGDGVDDVQHAVNLAAQAGVVGASIEDARPGSPDPIYAFAQSVDRVRAAVAAARSQSFPFTLTARADNFFVGRKDLPDTIARLQAFQEAGADVLFAPGLRRREDIETVLRSIDKPLNVLIGLPGMTMTTSELFEMGVKRISVGAMLARSAMTALMQAGAELRDEGTTRCASTAISGLELNRLFSTPDQSQLT